MIEKLVKGLGVTTGLGALTGAGMNAAGLYVIVNGVTGATMLGSTAVGTSAAGTVGIIAGTSGTIGAAGAILMAPVTIGVLSVAALSTIGYLYFFGDGEQEAIDEH